MQQLKQKQHIRFSLMSFLPGNRTQFNGVFPEFTNWLS